MLLQRQLDNRGFQLNRQGKVPFALGSEGHEALQAGAAMAFNRGKDILAPYYRDLGLCLGIGLSPYEIMLSIFARAADHNGGRQFPNHYSSKAAGLMSFSSILGGTSSARRRRRVRDQVSRRNRPRGARDLRRRHDERRRVARVDELRGGPQAAVRHARREQRVGDLDAARQADGTAGDLEARRRLRHAGPAFQRLRPDRNVRRRERSDGSRSRRRRTDARSKARVTATWRIRPTTTT